MYTKSQTGCLFYEIKSNIVKKKQFKKVKYKTQQNKKIFQIIQFTQTQKQVIMLKSITYNLVFFSCFNIKLPALKAFIERAPRYQFNVWKLEAGET